MREWLLLGLEYDRWANQRWETGMREFGIEEQARPVMSHIYASQERWLQRLVAEVPSDTEAFHGALVEVARLRDLDETIEYRTAAGQERRNTVQEILLHVINHGTYHRGQIRGLVDPGKTAQIPDTDIVLFLDERSAEK